VRLYEPYMPLPSVARAVIIVVPRCNAVTRPVESTVATSVLLELQLSVIFVAVAGSTVASYRAVPGASSVNDCAVNVTDITGVPSQ